MRLTLSFFAAFLFNGLSTPKVLSARVSSDVFMKVGEQADRLKSETWCCKCGEPAAKGKPVYSCSKRGLCRACNKFGGRKNATRIPAPYGGKCASREPVGAHYSCKKAFQASEAERQTAGEDVQQPEEIVGVAESERNTRPDSSENLAAPVDEEVMEQAEQVHQPEDSHGGAYEESTTTSDYSDYSEEETDVSLGEETMEGDEDEVHQPEDSTGEETFDRDETSQQPQDSAVGTDDTAASEPEEATAALDDEVKQPEAEEATAPLDETDMFGVDPAVPSDEEALEEEDYMQQLDETDMFGVDPAVPSDEEALEEEDYMQQPEDLVGVVDDKSSSVPDSEEETGVQIDAKASEEKALAHTGPACCKCSTPASNGKTVYSCSASGSCSICKKYGGQANAFRKPPSSGSKCAAGRQTGAHYSCKQLFESTTETELPNSAGKTEGAQDEPMKRDAYEVWSNNKKVREGFGKDPAVPSEEGPLEKEEKVQQPGDVVDVVDDKSNFSSDSEETGIQSDAKLPEEKAPSSGPVCCKCSTPASNGKTVYSCSLSGSCRVCKKYGGQNNAIRKSAPSGGKCASGKKITGTHSDCSQVFESEAKDVPLKIGAEKEGKQQKLKIKKSDAYEVQRNQMRPKFVFGDDIDSTATPDSVTVAGTPSDEELSIEKAPSSTEPVCCKCSTPASNGKIVYSCSARGTCHLCSKYGGQKNAIRKPAPSGGKCASGQQTGAHYDCRKAFEDAKGKEKGKRKMKSKRKVSLAGKVPPSRTGVGVDEEDAPSLSRETSAFEDAKGKEKGKRKMKSKRKVSLAGKVPPSRTGVGVDEEDAPSLSRETSKGPMCCKCGALASNGKTVYSCSTGGSCRACKKYGGQKAATKKPALAEGKCATGQNIGAHYECKRMFEGVLSKS